MMNKIVNHILRNKIQIFLIIGLSILSFFLCLIALTNSFAYRAQERNLKQLFRTDMNKTEVLEFSYVKDFDHFGDDISEIKENSRKEYGAACGAYEEEYTTFDELFEEPSYLACNREAYKGTFQEENLELSDVIFVDPDMMDIVDCGIEKDMLLPIIEGKELYYPIYVGNDYKKLIHIGDTLTYTTFDVKYKVMGYIEDANWFSYDAPFTFPVESMEHKFLAPFCKEGQTDPMTQNATVNQIFVTRGSNQTNLKKMVLDMATKKDIKINISSVENKLQHLKTENREVLKSIYSFTVVVMICSMISICSLLCTHILTQRKEYGIRLAYGETQKKQIILFAGRNLMMIMIAMVAAIGLVNKYLKVNTAKMFFQLYHKAFLDYAIPIVILLSIGYTVISLIPPVIMLNRLELVQLIKEEEL